MEVSAERFGFSQKNIIYERRISCKNAFAAHFVDILWWQLLDIININISSFHNMAWCNMENVKDALYIFQNVKDSFAFVAAVVFLLKDSPWTEEWVEMGLVVGIVIDWAMTAAWVLMSCRARAPNLYTCLKAESNLPAWWRAYRTWKDLAGALGLLALFLSREVPLLTWSSYEEFVPYSIALFDGITLLVLGGPRGKTIQRKGIQGESL